MTSQAVARPPSRLPERPPPPPPLSILNEWGENNHNIMQPQPARPQSRLPIRPTHSTPPQFTVSSNPYFPPQPIAWDPSITVPLPNNTTTQQVPLLAPQPQLPAVTYNQLQLGSEMPHHIAQGRFNPQMLHIQNPVVQQLPAAPRIPGGENPQVIPIYNPDPRAAVLGGYHDPLGVVNAHPVLCGAHAAGDLGSALRFGRSLTTSSSNLSLIPLLTDSKE